MTFGDILSQLKAATEIAQHILEDFLKSQLLGRQENLNQVVNFGIKMPSQYCGQFSA